MALRRWHFTVVECFLLAAQITFLVKGNRYEETTKVIDKMISQKRYDKRLRPYFQEKPVNITIRMSVVHFGQIREKEMDFEVDVFFTQKWSDERLNHSLGFTINLDGKYRDLVWQPDTFVLNIKKANFHNVPAANSDLAIDEYGNVTSSSRLTLVASCQMNLMDYPLDEQTCSLTLLSYAYQQTQLDYIWDHEHGLDPVIVLNKEMNEFSLVDIQTFKDVYQYPSGPWSHATVTFTFSRRIGYSLLQVYIPTMLIVSVSWLSFWVSKDAVPARITLSVTTILTIVTLMGSFRSQFPKVSYIKAVDVFLIISFLFVFGGAMEYVLVLLHSGIKRRGNKTGSVEEPENENAMEKEDNNLNLGREEQLELEENGHGNNNPIPRKRPIKCTPRKLLDRTKKVARFTLTDEGTSIIDRLSRFMFPLFYICFNMFYWMCYEFTAFRHERSGHLEVAKSGH